MLYIVNKSHANSQALHDCLQRTSAGDSVLLIEHAVYSALNVKQTPLLTTQHSELKIFALSPDMQARGVQQEACLEFIEYVDYQGFVELVENNSVLRSCF